MTKFRFVFCDWETGSLALLDRYISLHVSYIDSNYSNVNLRKMFRNYLT